ncbi:hypothetical protein ACFE04_001922 [Oxalis oulophora]
MDRDDSSHNVDHDDVLVVVTEFEGKEMADRLMKVLTMVDLDLTLASEKLVNLHMLLLQLFAQETDLQAMLLLTDDVSATSIDKALVFCLLSGVLDSEVKEVDGFVNNLQVEIVDARQKISLCQHLGDLFTLLEHKLVDSEDSWKQSSQQIFELQALLAKLQRTISTFQDDECENGESAQSLNSGYTSNIDLKLKMRTTRQQRHTLRMLEKSLIRELDFEKKLSDFKQTEQQLKLKLHHTEQVSVHMEEAAEFVWVRCLEAENMADVLMGISKDMVGRLQIAQFNINGSVQREVELKSKMEEQEKAKDFAVHKLEISNAQLEEKNSEFLALTEKVKLLEGQLKESENKFMNAKASIEETEEYLHHMEFTIQSLKENSDLADTRAENAEAKVSELTKSNKELSDEIDFLKGNESRTAQKITTFKKKVRDLEIQIQHSKASSEASQEQQNMLYSAIWDMETLIEDLKSKVAKAESKTDHAEEQCIILTDSNFELNKELNFMRERIEFLETSLEQANDAKLTSAEEINLRTELMMDMVSKLASERERIQKQLYSLRRDNELLSEKLRNTKKDESIAQQNGRVLASNQGH